MSMKGGLCLLSTLFLLMMAITNHLQWTNKQSDYSMPQPSEIPEVILVYGWKPRKQQPGGPAGRDYWFHLELAKTKSFLKCYDENYLDTSYQCEYTENKLRFNESHAVLFRGRRLNILPLPKWRPQDQKWIFYEHEPPTKVWEMVNLTKYNDVFNVTATFAMDSDIPKLGYLRTCVRKTFKYQQLQHINYAAKKRADVPVAWFVSVCSTQSKREEYVMELSRHIPVDIFGRCGPKSCGSSETWKSDNCSQTLLNGKNSYKFYLAFENSLCEDYVTEKLWKVLHLDIVPVVMGAVDYANMLPKDSYIDVKDFDSPRELAKYLDHLNEDDELYNQYIRNKNSLVCKILQDKHMPWECSLCKYLHEFRFQKKIVHTLDHFWGSRRCFKPSYFLERNDPGDFGYKRLALQ